MGHKTEQKSTYNWGHARACDTAMRVPVVMTTASQWCGLSMPLVLHFLELFFGTLLGLVKGYG